MKLQKARSVVNQHEAAISRVRTTDEAIAATERRIAELNQTPNRISAEITKTEGDIARTEAEIIELKAKLAEKQHDLDALRDVLPEKRHALTLPIPGMREAKHQLAELETQKKRQTAEAERWAKELEEAKATIASIAEKDLERRKLERLEAQAN